jgi:hypothetical protein
MSERVVRAVLWLSLCISLTGIVIGLHYLLTH